MSGGACLMVHLWTNETENGGDSFVTSNTTTTTAQLLHSIKDDPLLVDDDDSLLYFAEEKDSGSSENAPPNEEFVRNATWMIQEHHHHHHHHHQVVESANTENQGLELVSFLTSCAESVSCGDHAAIDYSLCRLGELACPGGSPIQRIAAYFTEALALRAVKLWPHVFSASPPRNINQIDDEEDDGIALRLLNQVSPIPNFLFFALNERLLSAFEGHDRVHIIDFDIKEGLQWPSLIMSLASRPNPPTHVRITGIGDSREELQNTGVRLRGVAESLNLKFEFHPVVDSLENVRLWMLHVKEGESVAVNCILQLHKALYDDNLVALTNLLGLIRSTNPVILLVGEEEAEHNEPRWEMRFANSLMYYSAAFDSMHSSLLPEDSLARIKIEEMFARRIRNIVACEGRERVERHEMFGKWQELMDFGGFRCLGFGEREEIQSRLLLQMYSSGENFSIQKRGGESSRNGLTLKWMDQPLYTVSAWAPISLAVSTSTTTSD